MNMTEKMTSRQRVYAALEHKQPDRVPIDFGGNFNSGIAVLGHIRLKRRLGVESPTYCRDVVPMLACTELDDGMEIMKMMGSDIIEFPAQMWTEWEDGLPTGHFGEARELKLKDGSTCLVAPMPPIVENADGSRDMIIGKRPVFRMPKDGFYFDRIYSPLAHVDTMEKLEEEIPKWKSRFYYTPFPDVYLQLLKRYAKLAHEQTDYFVLANMPAILSIWHSNLEFFGYEKYFMMMAAQPKMVHRWMEFTTEQNAIRLTQYLDACGEYINGIIIGDDYGNQRTTHMSPAMFRDQVKPYFKRLCDLIHKKTPHVKVFLHSCGAVKSLIGDFIEAGVDVLNPVQISAKDMDPAALKSEFGDDIAFWGGGIRAQETLYRGTVEECKEEVKRNMEIFMKDGGFVFAADHDIQEHVAPEKIIATFQTALEYGKY